MKPGNPARSACAVSRALDAIGDRWSLLILRDMMFGGKRCYGDFMNSEEGIATNILASRLTALEEGGLVLKRPDPAHGRRNLYFLTEKGIDLLPVILELMQWMARHDPGAQACTSNLARLETDRKRLLESLRKKLRDEHLVTSGEPAQSSK